jgi:hypothetical protein
VTHLGYAESLLFGLAEPFAGTADDADFLRAFAGMKAHAELRKFVAEALKLPAVTLTRGDVLDSLEMIESAKAKAEADKRAARPNNGTSADVGGSASTDTQSGTDTGSAPVGELKPVSMADEIRSARALVRGLAVDSVNTDALAELQKLAEAVAAKLAECAAAGNESDAPIADPADAS